MSKYQRESVDFLIGQAATYGHLGDFIQACHQAAAANGWWDQPRNDAEVIALIHSELSEALEGLRKPGESDKIPGFDKVEEEMADVLIRLFDYAGAKGLRLHDAMVAKLEHNQGRGYRHGKEF